MTRHNVLASSIQEGDVIAFKNHQDGNATKVWQYGVVITSPIKRAGQIQGFEVFPLEAHALGDFIKNDTHHYMYGPNERDTKELMGMHQNKNWRLRYQPLIIANHPSHLGIQKDGLVRKTGSIAGDSAFNAILHHASTLDINHLGLTRLDDELKQLGMRTSSGAWDNLALGSVQQGANLKKERQRQDTAEAGGFEEVRPTRAPYRRKALSTVTSLNITLEDAAKLNIITSELKEILSATPRGKEKPITTLREAYILADNEPERLEAFFNDEQDMSLRDALKAGHIEQEDFSFINTALAPEGRKNTLLSLRQIYTKLHNDPESILGTIEDEDQRLKIVDSICDAWEGAGIQEKEFPTDVPKQILSAWKEFRTEAIANETRFEGIKIMLPENSP